MELSLLCDASVVVIIKERTSSQIFTYIGDPEDSLYKQHLKKVAVPDYTNEDVLKFEQHSMNGFLGAM